MLIYVVDGDAVSRRVISATAYRHSYNIRYISQQVLRGSETELEQGCILLDTAEMGAGVVELMAKMKDRSLTMPVVVITGASDLGVVVQVVKLGAIDVLEKPLLPEALVSALEQCALALEYDTIRHDVAREADARLRCLTPRERDVLRGMEQGLANKTIGYELGISSRTVEIHRAHLMDKLRVRSLSELLRIVYDSQSDTPRRSGEASELCASQSKRVATK